MIRGGGPTHQRRDHPLTLEGPLGPGDARTGRRRRAISTWNFPFSMLSRKIAPALAAGCTIVDKPSEFTPFRGLLYAVPAEKADVPAGVVNVVTGDGAAVGGELSANPLVRKITFTGSTRVGKRLYSHSAGTMKNLSMELGGNAPTIVYDDADLGAAGAIEFACRGYGVIATFENWLQPFLSNGVLLPILPKW